MRGESPPSGGGSRHLEEEGAHEASQDRRVPDDDPEQHAPADRRLPAADSARDGSAARGASTSSVPSSRGRQGHVIDAGVLTRPAADAAPSATSVARKVASGSYPACSSPLSAVGADPLVGGIAGSRSVIDLSDASLRHGTCHAAPWEPHRKGTETRRTLCPLVDAASGTARAQAVFQGGKARRRLPGQLRPTHSRGSDRPPGHTRFYARRAHRQLGGVIE